jgi:hypothetical protein
LTFGLLSTLGVLATCICRKRYSIECRQSIKEPLERADRRAS